MSVIPVGGPRPMAEALNEATPLTRQQRRLLDLLADLGRAVTVVELSETLDSHPNTVREHLAVLEGHGLVNSSTVPGKGRGRPRKVYRTNAGARGAPARHLVGLVTAALKALPEETARADAYHWGETWGDDIAASRVFSAENGLVEGVASLMADMGFAPEPTETSDTCINLTQCPLLTSSRTVPPGLCEIHQGMIDRLLETEAPGRRGQVEPFAEPHACRLTLHM
ncbi:ArsR family transcriptional regulator [Flaviflexus salsibiostraticola]|uniref:ArsR family transcriptional regulator n=1 Tax=Flaviflexus salsibiostraticola TaxID=1282737 RepID=A0A3Q8WW98_9ACTO|nr:helix-turn-helix domain-containing protein [Flaviflexus salsibiostraticola]AZN30521.1 ArsR family transcriptional regulator [Flaviflexus salsibiostraticola]